MFSYQQIRRFNETNMRLYRAVMKNPDMVRYMSIRDFAEQDRLVRDWKPESGRYRWNAYALPISIGSRCWLGGGVIVLPGVSIGDGTVIGAGSVVTKDIPAGCVAVGNPCRVMRTL